jgi:hypothetical protein
MLGLESVEPGQVDDRRAAAGTQPQPEAAPLQMVQVKQLAASELG